MDGSEIWEEQKDSIAGNDTPSSVQHPPFSSLPLHPGDPPYSAWSLHGPHDELGTLNLLTPATTLRATQEITTGQTIPLNLPLHVPLVPMNTARKPLEHRLLAKGHANDDELSLNTQSSSQWDGLRHYPYQEPIIPGGREGRRFYNGARQADLVKSDGTPTPLLGTQNLARKTITGRGVLLDWASWASNQTPPINFDPFTTHAIPLAQLLACAEDQNTTFLPGDILLIRTGWTAAYQSLSPEQQAALAARGTRSFIGLEASEEMFRWHWEQGFSAVASDTNAYEAQPFTTRLNPKGVSCHEVLLSGWGMPIGELWDLEDLSRCCRKRGKWTFLVSSCPLDVEGGVGSPSNAVAIL